MKYKMKYTTIRSSSLYSLEKMVNTFLGGGWKPQGGICCDNRGEYYIQAMVKEK